MLPHLLHLLRSEPALAVTLCYALVAMAGIFYNVGFYGEFGVPVLTLSQIGDFLVAGLQQPMALLLVLSTFPLCWVFDRFNDRSRRRQAIRRDALLAARERTRRQQLLLRFYALRLGSLWYTQLTYVLVVAIYGWAFVGFYAHARAAQVKQGRAPQVQVWLDGGSAPLAASQGPDWTYLGAVSNYVFVYDRAAARALVLPVDAIARIQPQAVPTDARAGTTLLPLP